MKALRDPRLRALRRVVVAGRSMLPTLEPGDRLLLVPAWRLRRGDLVALVDPRDGQRPMIKRVGALDREAVEVLGDNPAESTDSRHFGPVSRSAIRGRAVYRYAPASRAGRFRR